MPTSLAALIVTLQPILTNALSGPILNEKVSKKQWTGVFLGFGGASIVLGLDIGSDIPLLGFIASKRDCSLKEVYDEFGLDLNQE